MSDNKRNQLTSLAQTARDPFTFSIESDFPVPGHPQIYKLPAFSCSRHCLENSTILFCSSSRHTITDCAFDTCNTSFTALNCSESIHTKLHLTIRLQNLDYDNINKITYTKLTHYSFGPKINIHVTIFTYFSIN